MPLNYYGFVDLLIIIIKCLNSLKKKSLIKNDKFFMFSRIQTFIFRLAAKHLQIMEPPNKK